MLSKVLILFVYVLVSEAQFEGERCMKGGSYGVCKNINRCQTAIDDLKRKINPQICSFDNTDPIICCLDDNNAANPGTITTSRPSATSTMVEYIPPMYDYETLISTDGKCEPIPEALTVKKTGQKALDKCIEYQEKYVYPCEKGLVGEHRSDKCHNSAEELIVGLTDAGQYEFPHMVMVGYGANLEDVKFDCGGALISDRYVLTAGHCISNRDREPITYVLVGALRRSDAADRSKIYKVKNIIKHPEYKPPNKYNDIALIETEKTIPLDEFLVPACLPVVDPIDKERVRATGWGLTQDSGSDTLKKVDLQKLSTSECKQEFKPVPQMKKGFDEQSQTCYEAKDYNKDTCQGDSGGPIQFKNKKIYCMYNVVGVTSFSKACGLVGKPGLYTRVLNYVPWIESIVWPN